MVTQQPFKPSYYRPICQLAIPENYDWRQFPRESPSKLSEKSRMPLQVALRHTERVLFGPFWRSYTGQIYGRNPAPTPFRTVSEGSFPETQFPTNGLLGNSASGVRHSRKSSYVQQFSKARV